MSAHKKRDLDLCHIDGIQTHHMPAEITEVVDELIASCDLPENFDHISPAPIPNRDQVVALINQARMVLFPGYFDSHVLDRVRLPYHMGQEVTRLFERLSAQCALAIQHDCLRLEVSCSQCSQRGAEVAMEFMRQLPRLRQVLAEDVRAALRGDPATKNADEVIFSYPGLFTVTVYRLAHELHHLGLPLLPRMMTEYAHGLTGIDIHPGAHIGQSFFIDHGTGIVVGETCEIGDNVRLYQGVTLGALSLGKNAGQKMQGKKRHPTIENDVIIYAGATILGGETVIGARSIIGGNVWLTSSVPPDTKVILKSPELEYIGPDQKRGA